MRLFDDVGRWTKEGIALSEEIETALETVLALYYKMGCSRAEIEAILCSSVNYLAHEAWIHEKVIPSEKDIL